MEPRKAVTQKRPLLLILVSLGLGILVWLDNRGDGPPTRQVPAPQTYPSPDAGKEAQDAGSGSEAVSTPAMASGARLENPLSTIDKSALKDWVERPLFAPSRKRPPPAASASAAAPQAVGLKPQPRTYELMGVVLDGGRAIALLRTISDGTHFRVETGDMIGGWRVARVDSKSVVLEREDGTAQTVPLYRE
jgi:hypothetical protein